MTDVIRSIPQSNLKILDELISERYPMFPNFISIMIRRGYYVVTDKNGTRLPTEQALNLLEN